MSGILLILIFSPSEYFPDAGVTSGAAGAPYSTTYSNPTTLLYTPIELTETAFILVVPVSNLIAVPSYSVLLISGSFPSVV